MKKLFLYYRQKSVFTKLISLFMFLLLPFMLFGFFSIIESNGEIKQNALESFDESLGSVADSIDTQLCHIYEQGVRVGSLSAVGRLSAFPEHLSNYERISAINFVTESLTIIKENNSLIENIQIHIPALGKVLNANGHSHGSIGQFSQERYDMLLNQSSPRSLLSYREQQISYLIPSSSKNPINLVCITFSETALRNYLSLFKTVNPQYMVLLAGDGTVVSGSILPPDDLPILPPEYEKQPWPEVYSKGIHYQYFVKEMNFCDLSLVCITDSSSIYYSSMRVTYTAVIILLMILLCSLTCYCIMHQIVKQPLNRLINAFNEIESGNLNAKISESGDSDFHILYHGFNHMIDYINSLIEKDYEQRLLLQKSEFKQLQAQINPHFLYNSFFLLSRLTQGGMTSEATDLSEKLAYYFQYITRSAQEEVTLYEEYRHAKVYLDIQAMRFEKRIQIICQPFPEHFRHRKVPKVILQPILENAFQYGLKNKTSGGILSLSFLDEFPKRLRILIEDSGDEMTDSTLLILQEQIDLASIPGSKLEMTGILNISRRLLIYSDGKDTLWAERSQLGGLKIIITLEENHVSITDC